MADQRKKLIIMDRTRALHLWVTRPGEEAWPWIPGAKVPNWLDCRALLRQRPLLGGYSESMTASL